MTTATKLPVIIQHILTSNYEIVLKLIRTYSLKTKFKALKTCKAQYMHNLIHFTAIYCMIFHFLQESLANAKVNARQHCVVLTETLVTPSGERQCSML